MNQSEKKLNDFIKKMTNDEDLKQDIWIKCLESNITEEEIVQFFHKIQSLSELSNILNNIPLESAEAIGNKINHLTSIEQQVLMLHLIGVSIGKICSIFYNIEKSKLIQIVWSFRGQK